MFSSNLTAKKPEIINALIQAGEEKLTYLTASISDVILATAGEKDVVTKVNFDCLSKLSRVLITLENLNYGLNGTRVLPLTLGDRPSKWIAELRQLCMRDDQSFIIITNKKRTLEDIILEVCKGKVLVDEDEYQEFKHYYGK